VEDATKACEFTEWKNFAYLDTLAAAHAESGDFGEAVKYQQKAIELAPQEVRQGLEQHLELYEQNKPLRQPATDDAEA
jgi:serine/threonine-protein kinase